MAKQWERHVYTAPYSIKKTGKKGENERQDWRGRRERAKKDINDLGESLGRLKKETSTAMVTRSDSVYCMHNYQIKGGNEIQRF